MSFLDRKFSFLALLLAAGTITPAFSGVNPDPLPLPREVVSELNSAEDTIDRMYVSDFFESKSEKVLAGVDVLELEIKALEKLVRTGKPTGKKIILSRYGVDDDRVFDLLIEAKKKGIPVQFITDANRALQYEFPAGEKALSDLTKADFKTSDMGPGIKRLIEAGFKFNHPKFGIFSQPLFNSKLMDMFPIMHEKSLLLIDGKNRKLLRGTANMTDSSRYNRMFEHSDPQFIDIYAAHADEMIKNFRQGKWIKDMTGEAPTRMSFKDGSSLEVAFTNGQFNPNDRISDVLKRAKNSVGRIQVEEIVMSHFAFTNRDFTNSLKVLLNQLKFEKRPIPSIKGIFDGKFSTIDGYGQAPILAGFDTVPPFGGAGKGIDEDFLGNFELYVYQRPALDKVTGEPLPEYTLDSAPHARNVMHDKSTLILVTEDGKKRAYFFTGSLNLSAHFDNAEDQVMYFVDPKSWLVDGYRRSVLDFIKRNPGYALEFTTGELRGVMGIITGHTDLTTPKHLAERVRNALRRGDTADVASALDALSKLPSKLSKRPTQEQVRLRIQRVRGFLDWYFQFDTGSTRTPQAATGRMRRLAALIPAIVTFEKEGKDGWEFVRQLNKLTWDPKAGDSLAATQQKHIEDVWKAMHLPGKAPLIADTGSAFYSSTRYNKKPVFFNFDWDDNLVFMPTKIRIFRKADADPSLPEVMEFSTSDWATMRHQVGVLDSTGKPTQYSAYEVLRETDGGRNSFMGFASSGDGPGGKNRFLEDLMSVAKKDGPTDWMGPAFVALKYACSSRDACENVRIITARSQDPQEIYEGLLYLRDQGFIKHVPQIENIYAVGGAQNPSMQKAQIMLGDLRQIQYKKISEEWDQVISPNGDTEGRYHLWTFSDDDWHNYVAARDAIAAEMKRGKFKNTKIMLFFTGLNHAEHPPEAVVLMENGTPRALIPDEEQNIAKVLKIDGSDCSDLLRYQARKNAGTLSLELAPRRENGRSRRENLVSKILASPFPLSPRTELVALH